MFDFSPIVGVVLFILGLSVGSFINCFAYRLNKEKSIKGRSFCDHCGHSLSVKDLIPLLSFLFKRGRCSYCNKKISAEHFFIELITGLLFLLFYTTNFAIYFIFIATLLVFVFIYTTKHSTFPDFVDYLLIVPSFFFALYREDFFAIIFAVLVFLFLKDHFNKKELSFLIFMSFFIGFPNVIIAVFLSLLIGAIMKKNIPSFVLGTILVHLFFDKLI